MNDLVPLKVLARNELEVSVLRSADADRAPPEAMQRVARILGVSASLLALSSTAGAASVAGLGAASLVKSLLFGVGAGVLVSGALFTASVVSEPSKGVTPGANGPAVVADAKRPASVAFRELARSSSATSPTEPDPATHARPSPPLQPLRSSEPWSAEVTMPPTPGTTSSIAAEVAELDGARALLAAGRANEALRVLDGYAVRWPAGVMALEASVVRVEVELARGNEASAQRLARALIAAHPNTGHARKVTRLLERANEK